MIIAINFWNQITPIIFTKYRTIAFDLYFNSKWGVHVHKLSFNISQWSYVQKQMRWKCSQMNLFLNCWMIIMWIYLNRWEPVWNIWSCWKVKNKAPAPVQITAEQLLREAKERELELAPPPPKQNITSKEELEEQKMRRRKVFEDAIRKEYAWYILTKKLHSQAVKTEEISCDQGVILSFSSITLVFSHEIYLDIQISRIGVSLWVTKEKQWTFFRAAFW